MTFKKSKTIPLFKKTERKLTVYFWLRSVNIQQCKNNCCKHDAYPYVEENMFPPHNMTYKHDPVHHGRLL